MSDLREAFEKWALSTGKYMPKQFSRDPDSGRYTHVMLEVRWEAWQAALQSQTAPAVPEFLLEMSQQMREQPNRLTSHPFWQVRCHRYLPTLEGCAEHHTEVCDDEGVVYRSDAPISEFHQYLIENHEEWCQEWSLENHDGDDWQSNIECYLDLDCDELPDSLRKIPVQEIEEVVSTHLTQAGAEQFIKRKQHDYPKLFTYVESAYWSPQLRELQDWIISLSAPQPDHSPDAGKVVQGEIIERLRDISVMVANGQCGPDVDRHIHDVIAMLSIPATDGGINAVLNDAFRHGTGFAVFDESGVNHVERCKVIAAPAADGGEVEPVDDSSTVYRIGDLGNQIHNLGCSQQNNEELADSLAELAHQAWVLQRDVMRDLTATHSAQPRNEVQAQAHTPWSFRKGDDWPDASDCHLAVAGIHVAQNDEEHGNRIEVWGQDMEAAQSLRDHILDLLRSNGGDDNDG